MKSYKRLFIIVSATVVFAACTKLESKLNDSLTPSTGGGSSSNAQALLNSAYNSLITPLNNQDQIFSLQENTTDECLVPTRGGDWDDNGVWRVLHAHTWTLVHSQFISVFNGLGQMESD